MSVRLSIQFTSIYSNPQGKIMMNSMTTSDHPSISTKKSTVFSTSVLRYVMYIFINSAGLSTLNSPLTRQYYYLECCADKLNVITREFYPSGYSKQLQNQYQRRIMNRLASSQQTLKKSKPSQENKRQGDWICMLCHNLNYSFRESCNRCKNLTREENMKLYNKTDCVENEYEVRQPLGEIFFQRMHSLQENTTTKEYIQQRAPSLKESRRSETCLQVGTILSALPTQFFKPEKSGFASLLYLTPTRYSKDNCEEQIQYPSYKSPMVLPSVSPLLRSLKL